MKFKFKNIGHLEEFNEYRSKRGLKTSRKRTFIIKYFLNEDRHFSVEELYNKIRKIKPNIGFSTVYRTLKLLAECGMASECNFDGISRYEPVHKAEHHDHLVCRRCGQIIEFENTEIEKLQHSVARKYRFTVESHRLELHGLCRYCAKKKVKG